MSLEITFFGFPVETFFKSLKRVLLVKWPDICTPTFLVQYLFGCIIKSTYLGDVPKAKSWDLGAYTGPWEPISVLGLK